MPTALRLVPHSGLHALALGVAHRILVLVVFVVVLQRVSPYGVAGRTTMDRLAQCSASDSALGHEVE